MYTFVQLTEVITTTYIVVVSITKLSIFLQFVRIFIPYRGNCSYYLIQVLIWSNILVFSALMLLSIFACTPRSKIWEPRLPGKCINKTSFWVSLSCIYLISDVFILVLPINWVSNLQMPSKRKFSISAVFALGTLYV